MSFWLQDLKGERQGVAYRLSGPGDVVLGRLPTANIYLDDSKVSRVHCRFRDDPDGCMIEDLGSTNGTFVNGSRITEALLKPDDLLIVGLHEFRVFEQTDEDFGDATDRLDNV